MKDIIDVIIDARMVDRHLHGIARYTYELIKNGTHTNTVKYHLLVNDIDMAKEIFKGIEGIEYILMKSKFLSLQEQIELPRIVNKFKKNAIFHSPSFVGSPFINKPMIMTIHDLNHIRFPEFYTPFHKYYYKYIVKTSANKSKKILTVSNFSKGELVEWLGCSEDKVVVTYNGIDESFKRVTNKKQLGFIKDKYNLPRKFILYVGNQKPHKNVGTLIKAFKELGNEDIYLVMNGKPSNDNSKLIKELGISNKVKNIGFVDDEDLASLYSLAEMFVFPSLYEGFGLPPLEAMACGCPVIVSDAASLPEVVGSSALVYSAKDNVELVNKIEQLLNNVNINAIIEDGINRRLNFKWNICTKKTIDEYKKIF